MSTEAPSASVNNPLPIISWTSRTSEVFALPAWWGEELRVALVS